MTDSTVWIHPTALMDQPYRQFQGGKDPIGISYRSGRLGQRVSIGAGAVIGRGVVLEDGVVVDHQCIIEPNVTIGRDALLIYRAIIGGDVVIGERSVIGGRVGEGSIIGAYCRVFGDLVHRQDDTLESWDEHEHPEASTVVHDYSFVGFGAVVIGGVHIGPRAYICAGSTIITDVPSQHIGFGQNRIVPASEWEGPLARNPIFKLDI